MKRNHNDDMSNKNKRFSFPNDNRSSMPSSHSGGSYYSYQTPMQWVDPRADHKNHANMNMYSHQNQMMMQWNNSPNQAPPPPPQNQYSPIYNPLQPPPPPLPLDRPPISTPPPPPPHNQGLARRNMANNNMRRRPPTNNPLRPDASGYLNLGSYKKNPNHQNANPVQKNGSNQSPVMPSTSMKSKNEKVDDPDKAKLVPAPLKVNKKARRKPMSERYTCKKEWNKDDALKALTLENAYNHLIKKVPMLILRFPDPELNKGLIHSYSPAIETVHFQQPSRARYCFVQLKPDADIEQVKEQISQISFGTGKISVENKITRHEVAEVTPEQLDPYTLYVGNLPTKLNVTIFKEKFPTAKRIDIGYAQRTKFTRYAFLHYENVDESMEAFKSTYNLTIDARSLVVRFRRNKGSVGLSEKGKKTKKDESVDGDSTIKEDNSKFRTPSTSQLFDGEADNKTNVLKQAEELRKTGYGATGPKDNLFGSKIKEEPVDFDDDDDCNSDEYGDGYGDGYGDPYDEDETFIQSDFDGSENDFDGNDVNCDDSTDPKNYGRRHWERSEKPIMKFKEEKADDYVIPSNPPQTKKSDSHEAKEKDDLDDLFNDLNPDDGLDL